MTTQITNLNGELPGHGYSTLADDPFLTAAERAYRPAPGSGYILTDAEVAAQIDGIMERSRLWLEEILARRTVQHHIITGDLS